MGNILNKKPRLKNKFIGDEDTAIIDLTPILYDNFIIIENKELLET
jgi:hypothetical protein